MSASDFFPQRPKGDPKIYAYWERATGPGLLKVGFTTRATAAERVSEQHGVKGPDGQSWKIVVEETASRNDGSFFMDHDVHRALAAAGLERREGEWFVCTADDVKAAIVAVRERRENAERRTETFAMRPEQRKAVEETSAYLRRFVKENPGRTPHYLWNCKMRFGKTFATYRLAKEMGWKRVLVLTFKPAVEDAWRDDLMRHVDFEGWRFISKADGQEPAPDGKFVCFGSFQDYLGVDPKTKGIKTRQEWVHTMNWDCVVLDEYHYGAWRKRAKSLFDDEAGEEEPPEEPGEDDKPVEMESLMPITSRAYLYLSGTPFRALMSGDFIEDQIYSWTYSDEQREKERWDDKKGPNPYAALPRMVLMTYQLPDSIQTIARGGEFDEFDLNTFFKAEGRGKDAHFLHETEVQSWLDLLRGSFRETDNLTLKQGAQNRPPWPYHDARLLGVLTHTLWYLPDVASCFAMGNLLRRRNNAFYRDYKVIVAAGAEAGIGLDALAPVRKAMGTDPLQTKTITLSCNKLTTGVTVRPWTGILMLRNLNSPESYFQAAFRVQSPWTMPNPDGQNPNGELIIKRECYVFDFAPTRALRQIADYSRQLDTSGRSPEKKVEEFIRFLPVLAYDGSVMRQIDAMGVLDMAISGTTATLLARKWESALLVNVDNETLRRLLANAQAIAALEKIEGFRALNQTLETIINKSEAVKKMKRDANGVLTPRQQKALTEEEKEYKTKRKEIQEKLMKFAARIPVFMYLTDYREETLKDVITKIEPNLFKRVTGLDVADFDLLVSLNVFDSALMNDAVFKFKQYEDSSLSYTGIDTHHADTKVGGYDTVINKDDLVFVSESSDG
jgi:hypothetical protein